MINVVAASRANLEMQRDGGRKERSVSGSWVLVKKEMSARPLLQVIHCISIGTEH